MATRTHLPASDRKAGHLQVSVSLFHLLVLAGAKLLDTATTAAALWLAPQRLVEAQPTTAALIARLGLLEGTLVVGVLAVAGVVALAELAGGGLAAARRWTGVGPAWLPYSVRAFTYYFAAGWFGLLAVSNVWVLASVPGVPV